MSNIRIDIASEFKDKGFRQATKSSTMLQKQFKSLAKTFLAVFSTRQIIAFGKASVNAFAAAEKEAALLRSQLTGINLAFATPYLDDYLDKLELLTGKTGDELVPAFNSLSQATQDITKAQELLNLALDVSAGTGKDLGTVSAALQRAYKGETTAIAKLRLGLTTAELKGKKFGFVVKELERRFGGSAQRNAETFGGSVNRIKRSVEQAQESIGKGFVTGLEKSGMSVEDFQKNILDLGEATGEVAGKFTSFTLGMASDISTFLNSSAYLKFRDAIDFLFRQANFVMTGEMLVPKSPSTAAGNQRRAAEIAARAELRARNLILQQEKKNAKTRQKIETEEERRRRLLLAQKRAQTIFDIENIQIVAALQGKIDGEQRMRLVALLALNTENYTAAEKLTDIVVRLNAPALANLGVLIQAGDTVDDVIKKLITSQAKLAGLQLMAEDFPELDNIFEDWETSLENILKMLMEMFAMLNGQSAKATIYPYSTALGRAVNPYGAVNRGEYSDIYGSLAQTPMDYSTLGLGAVSRGEYASYIPRMSNGGANITVNVAGNVTTEGDLVNSITNALYQSQKDGKNILYSSTAI